MAVEIWHKEFGPEIVPIHVIDTILRLDVQYNDEEKGESVTTDSEIKKREISSKLSAPVVSKIKKDIKPSTTTKT